MVKKQFERRPVLDPAISDLLDGMEQRQLDAQLPKRLREKKARERAKIASRREQRATYDLPPQIRQRVKELADQLSLPASQLVSLALLNFLNDYRDGLVDLAEYKQPSRSPRYDWVLKLPEDILPATKRSSKEKSGIQSRIK